MLNIVSDSSPIVSEKMVANSVINNRLFIYLVYFLFIFLSQYSGITGI